MSPITVALLAIAGVVALIVVGLILSVLAPWARAFLSAAPVPMALLVGMRIRRTDIRSVLTAYIRCVKSGADVSLGEIETHTLRGGDPVNAATLLVLARNSGAEATFEECCQQDLAGLTVVRGPRRDLER